MSDYPTIQPSMQHGYEKLSFKIRQVGTLRPAVYIKVNDMKTTILATTIRTDEGRYIIAIPSVSNIMGAGIRSYSRNRLIDCSLSGSQLNIRCYELVDPNSNGGLYKDGFTALVTLYYKPSRTYSKYKHYGLSYMVGFKLTHSTFMDAPTLSNAFSNFGAHIGVVSECESIGDDITKSRYLIKGLGSLLKNGFSVGGMSLAKASTNLYFNRSGNDLIIGVNALESTDDDTTWQLSPQIINEAIFFIQFANVAR